MTLNLSDPIEKLSYIGPKNLPRLKKLGIKNIKDLLWHFPARHDDYSSIIPIASIKAKEPAMIQGEVVNVQNARIWKRRLHITTAIIKDNTDTVRAVWFNQPYIANQLKEGVLVNIAGKVSLDKRGVYFSSPTYEKVGGSAQQPTHTGRLVPRYPETDGITSKYLRFLVKQALNKIPELPDPIPNSVLKKYSFPKISQAVKEAHFPPSQESLRLAKDRLAFEELLFFQLKALQARRNLVKLKAPKILFNERIVKSFVESLPFKLTADQKIAAFEILKDLERTFPMNRLLNGDVGSGKTVVALIAAYQTVKAGYQVAFMAPTEILAQQHYATITLLLGNSSNSIKSLRQSRDKSQVLQVPSSKLSPFGGSLMPTADLPKGSAEGRQAPIRIGLLTSSTALLNGKELNKSELKKELSDGKPVLLVGTHALIQKDVRFKNLGLVIIDEQHRFGVKQRMALLRGQTQTTDTRTDAENSLLYEDLTYKIRGCILKVKEKLGLGHKETIYQNALEAELKNINLNIQREKAISIIYGGKKIGTYQPDFIVEDEIILELKALPFIGNTEKRQIWTYLKGSPYKLALLVNFSSTTADIIRIVYDTAREGQRQSASSPRESANKWVPHLLSMTATPIPRTLALTIYGDLDISLIKEKPKGRQKIMTRVISPVEKKGAYKFIDEEIEKGRQVFLICPRIELPNTNTEALRQAQGKSSSQMSLIWQEVKAVKAEYEKISKEILPHRRAAMLHGKLKPAEKEKIMKDFKDGEYDILVSTSVIEVGVDIPNAAIMAVENAERFGLAQLHQFRGRVGRGDHQSHCLLICGTKENLENKRLKALINCDDGFELAESDLRQRGPGQFLGSQQSGIPDLAMASLTNLELIKKARLEAKLILKGDPSLKNYPLLRSQLIHFQKIRHFE